MNLKATLIEMKQAAQLPALSAQKRLGLMNILNK